ncbi:MAG: threonylcarbamoyl-AMP synthase [Candidatus Nomurabacteria bacterium]|nr:threonylcarbamoyl-AMP synthase [Candidatus Nomurabacteria bacterium]
MKIFKQNQLDEIVAELNAGGGVVAVPTETVYGLAVKYDDPSAVDKLTQLKKRTPDSGKIFALMLSDIGQISKFAIENNTSKRLAQKYFPGELTLVLPKNPTFSNPYFDDFDSIGIRIPNHKFMLELLNASGPLIVTSANYMGEPPVINDKEIIERLTDIDACVVGQAGNHPPSTVIRVTGNDLGILRQGTIKIS